MNPAEEFYFTASLGAVSVYILLALAVLLAGCTTFQDAVTPQVSDSDANHVWYYTFDNANTSGSTALDSLNQHDGSIESGVTTGATGRVDEAYNFNATTNGIAINNSFDVTNFSAFTVAMWVKLQDSSTQNIYRGGSGGGFGIIFAHNSDSTHTTCSVRNQSNDATVETPTGVDLGDNQWHHIACSWDATSTNVSVYVDGVLENESSTGVTDLDTSTDPTIGHDGGSNNPVDGLIDEPSFWNRTLNATEISNLYNNGAGWQYPFRYGVNGTVTDGNGNAVQNAQVVVIDQSTNTVVDNVSTDVNGKWTGVLQNNVTVAPAFYDPNNTSLDGDIDPHVSVRRLADPD